jgi:predicted transcriptional regulator
LTDRTRVGGLGSNTQPGSGDKTAEDGFQKALGQRLAVPTVPQVQPAGQRAKPLQKGPLGPSARFPTQVPAQPLARPKPQAIPLSKPASPLRQPDTQARRPEASKPEARTSDDTGRFSGLGDRLVVMRKTLGITQVELARRMGSTQPAMARIEKGEMKPNLRTLARYGEAIGQRVEVAFAPLADQIADFGDVPTDRIAIDEVPEALSQVRRRLGVTQAQVATAMETSQPVIARLESGEAVPNLRTLERYCEALGVEPIISFVATVAAVPSIETGMTDGDDHVEDASG